MIIFDNYPKNHPAYETLLDTLLGDRCFECDEVKAEGQCPDCDTEFLYCGDCLKVHQELEHGV